VVQESVALEPQHQNCGGAMTSLQMHLHDWDNELERVKDDGGDNNLRPVMMRRAEV
jgi:hypothetical protein